MKKAALIRERQHTHMMITNTHKKPAIRSPERIIVPVRGNNHNEQTVSKISVVGVVKVTIDSGESVYQWQQA